MDSSRLLECLRHDAARLRAAAADIPERRVPSCPDWTVADLLSHVGHTYLHKVYAIRDQARPRPWPPPELAAEQPMALFDRSLGELLAAFETHDPADPAWTWYDADQTVGFWLRRMAHETVIHRVDAELAAGAVTAIPADLALDGVDEALAIHLSWDSIETIEQEGGTDSWRSLADADGRTVEVRAADQVWSVTLAPTGVGLTLGGTPDTAASVAGEPADVLLWLWRRADAGKLDIDGDRSMADRLHAVMADATQ